MGGAAVSDGYLQGGAATGKKGWGRVVRETGIGGGAVPDLLPTSQQDATVQSFSGKYPVDQGQRDIADQIAETVDPDDTAGDAACFRSGHGIFQADHRCRGNPWPHIAGIEPQSNTGRHRRHDVPAVKRGTYDRGDQLLIGYLKDPQRVRS